MAGGCCWSELSFPRAPALFPCRAQEEAALYITPRTTMSPGSMAHEAPPDTQGGGFAISTLRLEPHPLDVPPWEQMGLTFFFLSEP